MPKCDECNAFLAVDEGQGFCRAHPPTVVKMDSGLTSAFPIMLVSGWCRKFEPLPGVGLTNILGGNKDA